MKILLINPPTRKSLRAEIPLKIDKEIGAFPSLGLLYIASFVKEKMPEADIEIIDAKLDDLGFDEFVSLISFKNPDLVGITALTFSLLDVMDLVRLIKEISTGIKICLGGPHVSIFARETLSLNGVDFVILGEGEEAFVHLLKNLKGSFTDLMNIKGLGFKDNEGNPIINEGRQFITDLDSLPIPDRRLINYKKCYSLLAVAEFIATVQTTRGCPYRCIYCDQQSGKTLRKRSVPSIIKEIKQLYDLGIKEIFFVDDLFTLDKKRVFDFCDRLIDEKIDLSFKISARVDSVEENMLRRLKSAGCYRIHYGVECGNQRILDKLKKGINLTQVKNAFRWTKQAGIDTFAYFMLGCPEEGRKEILDTVDFALKLNPDYAHFSICTPYPDTKLYRMSLDEGVIKNDYWRGFAMHPDENFKTKFWTKELRGEELVSLQNYANKRFYFRPHFLIKEAFKRQPWSMRLRKMRTAYKIFNP